jgi:hypothetical protein
VSKVELFRRVVDKEELQRGSYLSKKGQSVDVERLSTYRYRPEDRDEEALKAVANECNDERLAALLAEDGQDKVWRISGVEDHDKLLDKSEIGALEKEEKLAAAAKFMCLMAGGERQAGLGQRVGVVTRSQKRLQQVRAACDLISSMFACVLRGLSRSIDSLEESDFPLAE